MDTQTIYKTFRPIAVELAERKGVPLADALHALVRASQACPSVTSPMERTYFMRQRIEHEIVQGRRREAGLRATA